MLFNNLNLISEEKAEQWKTDVISLNTQTLTLLTNVGEALKGIKDDCDSTYVDEIYKYGSKIVAGSKQVLEGMNKLSDVVNSFLGGVRKFIDDSTKVVVDAMTNSR